MNRKQRRASSRSGAGSRFGPAVRPGAARELATLLSDAAANHRAGALVQAERGYRHILTRFSTSAETHSRLGAVLMAQGRTNEAIASIERALSLDPRLFEALGNLAQAYLAAERVDLAISAAARAVEISNSEQARALFALCAKPARFVADDDKQFRNLMVRALAKGWTRPRELTGVCISLIKLNPALAEGIKRAGAAWPRRLPTVELFGPSGCDPMATDELLCRILECDPVTDLGLERLLSNVRAGMLRLSLDEESTVNDSELQFYAALAQQCFINEYVWPLQQIEVDQAQELASRLAERIKTGAPIPALWPITIGAYFPLFTLAGMETLSERAWPPCVEAVIVRQINEPAQERRLAGTIPALTAIEDEVSKSVREQYEESPYPRWTAAASPNRPTHPLGSLPKPDILIAGCGTGLSTIEFAQQMRGARILAIDLSLASLAYAKRMAAKFELTNIEFAQADILLLAAIERQFDFINASGVLHHMADPWKGWRVLLSLLRPGGTMQVGLYSDIARRNVVAARALIAERGYRPVADEIRLCREEITASDDPSLRSVAQSQDFFTVSECRDLLFHVHEVRVTLNEIKSFLAENNLHFLGFNLEPATLQKFAARFPGNALTDLDCWRAFEMEMPKTFASMYQFQVRKPAQ